MMLPGQKTLSGLAALGATTAMLALTLSYNVPPAEMKLAETTIYLNEVYFFVPHNDVMVPVCGIEKGVAVACEHFPVTKERALIELW